MTPCRTAVFFAIVILSLSLGESKDFSEDLKANANVEAVKSVNRPRRQIIIRPFNNTIGGINRFFGSASFSMESFGGSAEGFYPLLTNQQPGNETSAAVDNTVPAPTPTTTTTTASPTTAASGRDLTQTCTCVEPGQCVTFQEIFDLCMQTVRDTDTCLVNLDRLCDSLKARAAG